MRGLDKPAAHEKPEAKSIAVASCLDAPLFQLPLVLVELSLVFGRSDGGSSQTLPTPQTAVPLHWPEPQISVRR